MKPETRREWLRKAAGIVLGLPVVGSATWEEAINLGGRADALAFEGTENDVEIAPAGVTQTFSIDRDYFLQKLPAQTLIEELKFTGRYIGSDVNCEAEVVQISSRMQSFTRLSPGDRYQGYNGQPLEFSKLAHLAAYAIQLVANESQIVVHLLRGGERIDYKIVMR